MIPYLLGWKEEAEEPTAQGEAAAAEGSTSVDLPAGRVKALKHLLRQMEKEETLLRGQLIAKLLQREPPAGVQLVGKTIVVTGGSSGIGRSIALSAAKQGAHVVIIDKRDAPLEGGAATTDGSGIILVRGDVSKKADLEAAAAEAVRRWGRLDVWVNNAALDLTDPPHNRDQKLLSTTEA